MNDAPQADRDAKRLQKLILRRRRWLAFIRWWRTTLFRLAMGIAAVLP